MSLPIKPWKNIAVDPGVIPMGSKVFVPAYCPKHGWMVAGDTGGAIQGLHIDVVPLAAQAARRRPAVHRPADLRDSTGQAASAPARRSRPAHRRALRPLSCRCCTRAIRQTSECRAVELRQRQQRVVPRAERLDQRRKLPTPSAEACA